MANRKITGLSQSSCKLKKNYTYEKGIKVLSFIDKNSQNIKEIFKKTKSSNFMNYDQEEK